MYQVEASYLEAFEDSTSEQELSLSAVMVWLMKLIYFNLNTKLICYKILTPKYEPELSAQMNKGY